MRALRFVQDITQQPDLMDGERCVTVVDDLRHPISTDMFPRHWRAGSEGVHTAIDRKTLQVGRNRSAMAIAMTMAMEHSTGAGRHIRRDLRWVVSAYPSPSIDLDLAA